MDVNNNLERFFRMLIETLHCFFVSFWMVEIISRLSFDDRVGNVGVSAPTADRQTQAAPVLESGIAT